MRYASEYVEKPPGKNAGQHVSDLEMLRGNPTIQSQFFKKDGSEKEMTFIHVDGGGDESPSHIETQFMWTEWHMKRNKVPTVVTTRYSGGSFLNEVEHLNGLLCRSASNLFIPSTLCGPSKDPETGDSDPLKIKDNMFAAREVYIQRVDQSGFKGGH